MNNTSNEFLIGHWNCRSINNKKIILNKILNDNNYAIFALNETMLKENNNLKFENYNLLQKNRKVKGGGVGLLINKNLEFQQITTLDSYDFEIICAKIKLQSTSINFISWYLPPPNSNSKNSQQNNQNFCEKLKNLFKELEKLRPFILCGDLNSHSTSWYCTLTNTRGVQIEEMVQKHNFNIINNNKPTLKNIKSDYSSVIDLVIISNDISDKLNYFKVDRNDYTSDHYPIRASFKFVIKKLASNKDVKQIKKIDWKE